MICKMHNMNSLLWVNVLAKNRYITLLCVALGLPDKGYVFRELVVYNNKDFIILQFSSNMEILIDNIGIEDKYFKFRTQCLPVCSV